MKENLGAIGIATLLTVVSGAVVSVVWVITYVNSAIAPVAAQAQAAQVQIASMSSDIQWIKAALESNGFKPSASLKQ